MKKIIYFLFCFIYFSAISQQPFAPIGAKWHSTPLCPISPYCGYIMYESVKDTLVGGQTARKIKYTRYTQSGAEVIPEATLIMYGDDDKVYYYFEEEYHVLYDFSAQAGDTLEIKIGAFAKYHAASQLEPASTGYFRVVVDSVGTTQINNETLRVLYQHDIMDFSPDYLDWGFGINGDYNTAIIERIGNTTGSGFFGDSFEQILGFNPYFRCYEDSDISYKNPNYNVSCDDIDGTDAVENLKTNNFEISPNPTSNSFFIKNKNASPEKTSIQLIDFQGVTLFQKEKTITKNETLEVNTDHLASGIYFLKINHNNTFTIKKIIVNH